MSDKVIKLFLCMENEDDPLSYSEKEMMGRAGGIMAIKCELESHGPCGWYVAKQSPGLMGFRHADGKSCHGCQTCLSNFMDE